MYIANEQRYEKMKYNRCGKSGLLLPAISLGLWHNFGGFNEFENGREIIRHSFDNGITHFDLANNYGPPPGSAEEFMGRMLKGDLAPYRDELIISSKAGYHMWEGPYGEWGSKKYLVASIDQSLKRMGLEYVDIFYHHRPDPNTPIEETMAALDLLVRQGKALYVGISNYSAEETKVAIEIAKELKTPLIIHQPRYSMLDRWIEDGLQDVLLQNGLGSIVFSPLAQGLLTNRYLNGVPKDSRIANEHIPFLQEENLEQNMSRIKALHEIAVSRGQDLAQMAISWIFRNDLVTSVLVGASKPQQITDNIAALNNLTFSQTQLDEIEKILG